VLRSHIECVSDVLGGFGLIGNSAVGPSFDFCWSRRDRATFLAQMKTCAILKDSIGVCHTPGIRQNVQCKCETAASRGRENFGCFSMNMPRPYIGLVVHHRPNNIPLLTPGLAPQQLTFETRPSFQSPSRSRFVTSRYHSLMYIQHTSGGGYAGHKK
jgi:hypothetical protein